MTESVLSFLSACEGGAGGDASSTGDQVSKQVVKTDAAADNDAKPSTTTTGNLIKAVFVFESVHIAAAYLYLLTWWYLRWKH